MISEHKMNQKKKNVIEWSDAYTKVQWFCRMWRGNE